MTYFCLFSNTGVGMSDKFEEFVLDIQAWGKLLSVAATLSFLFAVIYNFGFFLAIRLTLLNHFQLSDYVTSAITSLPFVIFLALAYERAVYWSIAHSKAKSPDTADRSEFERKFGKCLSWIFTALFIPAFVYLFWQWIFYPDAVALIVVLSTVTILAIAVMTKETSVSYGRYYHLICLSCMCLNFSYVLGKAVSNSPPTVSMIFSDGRSAKVNVIRNLNNSVIYMKDDRLHVISKERVQDIIYQKRSGDLMMFDLIDDRH
ncbi:MAG: hypothetical protein DI586_08150 [Micavibrio aeruginosavorus]|uniref:Uncharacterized protein n=1 Tax=Micavibrio aeruginosavorus TaxID=349221 RepID=A0A2W5HHA7_9BACT|nr:MAG: hypothetical protein DI586_08150 [Micavibrio aeruginosavorus]